MWECLGAYFEGLEHKKPDASQSFFVGDAAGRAQDHSSDDKNFAANAELQFYTPEDFFVKDKS